MKLKFKQDIARPQPDPFMCPVEDGWAMYVSGVRGIEAYACDSPLGQWEHKGTVFAMDGYHEYWAPCMYYENGWYYLYFSCAPIGSEVSQEILRVSKAPTPFGPFEEAKQLCNCFSIDPHVVRTEAGLFLWYSMDRLDTDRVGTRIYVQRMRDPETLDGDPVEAVSPSFDQEIFMYDRYQKGQHWHTIEGAFWIESGDWQYVMYSGACYQNDTYHIGYAAAKTRRQDLTGVCFEKHTDNGRFVPLLTKNEEEEGVGHHSVIFWEGQYYAVYHARDLTSDPRLIEDRRTARICRLHFADGRILVERR